MKKFDFFVTGRFNAAEMQEMRDKADKPKALFEIGQRLRAIRKEQNVERAAAAALCGISTDHLGRFEHGTRDIGFPMLDKYCQVLGLDISALLLPYLGKDAEAVRTVVDLARTWTSEGKSLSIEDVIGIGAMPR